jgi:hypothetical protein
LTGHILHRIIRVRGPAPLLSQSIHHTNCINYNSPAMGILRKLKGAFISTNGDGKAHELATKGTYSSSTRNPRPGPRVTGKRKATRTARKKTTSQIAHTSHKDDKSEPKPSEYLYFGEAGASRQPASHSSLSSNGQSGSTSTSSSSSSSSVPTTQSTGARDDSGLLSTGVRTQNVGYQNVTSGGSMQYDYAQTQPGV